MVRLAASVERPRPARQNGRALRDSDLPHYSVLVPLNDEAAVVPDLCAALARLDYPAAKLEILFLVEARDRPTRLALETHLRPETQRIVTCPPGGPRTKPRALNIGLALARGDLVVIYDAEDEPAADQLRLAAAKFAMAGPGLACLQAVLTVYNDDESRLARLFRLEYAALFHVVLPGLAQMGLPIPLGGTSNHFRRDTLVAAGGWDAWNVTEDADLGLRLAALGYDVDVLASETAEAAPEVLGQWFPQRTRWFKGWIRLSMRSDFKRHFQRLASVHGSSRHSVATPSQQVGSAQ
jgi:cellulose synthase/poly-beta-1,6-N-acetylglucosamine synthase-like glycosyltransferase